MKMIAKKIVMVAFLASLAPALAVAGNDKCKGNAGDCASKKMGHHMKMMDTNEDGKISAEENAAMAAKRFEKKDTNNDGFLDEDEMKASKDKMKEHKKWKNK